MSVQTVEFDRPKLERRCVELCLLLGEVAERAGVSRVTVTKAFNGVPIGLRSARCISRVLESPLSELLVDERSTQQSAGAA